MLLRWIVSALAVGIAAYLIPGVEVTPVGALIAAIVIALVNVFLRPILIVLTLPITVVTLGLFALVINAVLIALVGSIVPGFSVDGFWPAFWFAIVLALVNYAFGMVSDE